MVEIADLRDCAPSGLFYGGRAGQKEGILIEGEPWIAKYPRTTRDLAGKHLPSYTSSPVSEYLGSRIYELLGIPVHETMLGYRAGKIVCACRDFTFPNARLFEFKEIKNALPDDDAGFGSAPSDGEVILLGDVLADIKCFAAAVDMEAIDTLIDSVPEEAYGVVLLSESMREEHKRLLRKRLEEGILPLLCIKRHVSVVYVAIASRSSRGRLGSRCGYSRRGISLVPEHFADVGGNAEVGMGVARGGGAVDDGQMIAAEIVDEARGRVHGQARAGDH